MDYGAYRARRRPLEASDTASRLSTFNQPPLRVSPPRLSPAAWDRPGVDRYAPSPARSPLPRPHVQSPPPRPVTSPMDQPVFSPTHEKKPYVLSPRGTSFEHLSPSRLHASQLPSSSARNASDDLYDRLKKVNDRPSPPPAVGTDAPLGSLSPQRLQQVGLAASPRKASSGTDAIAKLTDLVAELRRQLDYARDQTTDKRSERNIRELEAALEQCQAQKRDLTLRLCESDGAAKRAAEELRVSEQTVKDQANVIERLKEMNADQQGQLTRLGGAEKNLHKARVEYNEASETLRVSRQRNDELQAQVLHLKSALAEKEEMLKKRADSTQGHEEVLADRDKKSRMLDEALRVNEELRGEISALHDRLQRAEHTQAVKEAELASLKQEQCQGATQEDLARIREERDAHARAAQEAQEQLGESRRELAILKSAAAEADSTIASRDAAIASLRQQLQLAQQTATQHTHEEVERVREERDALSMKLQTADRTVEELRKELENLLGHVKELEAGNGHLSQQNAQLRDALQEKDKEIASQRKQLDEAATADGHTIALQNALQQSAAEVTKLREELAEHREAESRLQENVSELTAQKAAMEAMLEQANQPVDVDDDKSPHQSPSPPPPPTPQSHPSPMKPPSQAPSSTHSHPTPLHDAVQQPPQQYVSELHPSLLPAHPSHPHSADSAEPPVEPRLSEEAVPPGLSLGWFKPPPGYPAPPSSVRSDVLGVPTDPAKQPSVVSAHQAAPQPAEHPDDDEEAPVPPPVPSEPTVHEKAPDVPAGLSLGWFKPPPGYPAPPSSVRGEVMGAAKEPVEGPVHPTSTDTAPEKPPGLSLGWFKPPPGYPAPPSSVKADVLGVPRKPEEQEEEVVVSANQPVPEVEPSAEAAEERELELPPPESPSTEPPAISLGWFKPPQGYPAPPPSVKQEVMKAMTGPPAEECEGTPHSTPSHFGSFGPMAESEVSGSRSPQSTSPNTSPQRISAEEVPYYLAAMISAGGGAAVVPSMTAVVAAAPHPHYTHRRYGRPCSVYMERPPADEVSHEALPTDTFALLRISSPRSRIRGLSLLERARIGPVYQVQGEQCTAYPGLAMLRFASADDRRWGLSMLQRQVVRELDDGVVEVEGGVPDEVLRMDGVDVATAGSDVMMAPAEAVSELRRGGVAFEDATQPVNSFALLRISSPRARIRGLSLLEQSRVRPIHALTADRECVPYPGLAVLRASSPRSRIRGLSILESAGVQHRERDGVIEVPTEAVGLVEGDGMDVVENVYSEQGGAEFVAPSSAVEVLNEGGVPYESVSLSTFEMLRISSPRTRIRGLSLLEQSRLPVLARDASPYPGLAMVRLASPRSRIRGLSILEEAGVWCRAHDDGETVDLPSEALPLIASVPHEVLHTEYSAEQGGEDFLSSDRARDVLDSNGVPYEARPIPGAGLQLLRLSSPRSRSRGLSLLEKSKVQTIRIRHPGLRSLRLSSPRSRARGLSLLEAAGVASRRSGDDIIEIPEHAVPILHDVPAEDVSDADYYAPPEAGRILQREGVEGTQVNTFSLLRLSSPRSRIRGLTLLEQARVAVRPLSLPDTTRPGIAVLRLSSPRSRHKGLSLLEAAGMAPKCTEEFVEAPPQAVEVLLEAGIPHDVVPEHFLVPSQARDVLQSDPLIVVDHPAPPPPRPPSCFFLAALIGVSGGTNQVPSLSTLIDAAPAPPWQRAQPVPSKVTSRAVKVPPSALKHPSQPHSAEQDGVPPGVGGVELLGHGLGLELLRKAGVPKGTPPQQPAPPPPPPPPAPRAGCFHLAAMVGAGGGPAATPSTYHVLQSAPRPQFLRR